MYLIWFFLIKRKKGDKTVLDFVPFMIAVYLIVFALRVFLLWGKCEPFIFDPNALLPRLFSQAGPLDKGSKRLRLLRKVRFIAAF